MRQQVNLYQPIFRRQHKVFSALTMMQVAAVVVLGLALLYGFGRWQEAAVGRDVATLVAQRDSAQTQFDGLSTELAARRDTSALTQQLQQAGQTLAAKRRLLQWLAARGGNQVGEGFADHIEGLARQHRPGLQLVEIAIGAGGQQVRLAGSTTDAAGLVRYLRRLGGEPAFAGVEFRALRIERVEGAAVDVEFLVASELLEEKERP